MVKVVRNTNPFIFIKQCAMIYILLSVTWNSLTTIETGVKWCNVLVFMNDNRNLTNIQARDMLFTKQGLNKFLYTSKSLLFRRKLNLRFTS